MKGKRYGIYTQIYTTPRETLQKYALGLSRNLGSMFHLSLVAGLIVILNIFQKVLFLVWCPTKSIAHILI